jgi:hypothetical protein
MKHITRELTLLSNALHSSTARTVFMVLMIALFVLSAGAPNATIGIGK